MKTPCGADQKSVHDSSEVQENSNGPEIQRTSRKERDGPEPQRAKERNMAESIPFKFGSKSSNANVFPISTKYDTDGKENKEDYLIFGTQGKDLTQTIEPIDKGAQTAQRHLVELTRHQFKIHLEMQDKKDNGREIPECKIMRA